MNIDLDPGAAPSPERTLQLAECLAEIVRVLNHQTRHHEALRDPADADRLLRELASAAGRLPQLLEQVSGWLAAEAEAGRTEVTAGQYAGQETRAAATVAERLVSADAYAGNLRFTLNMAAEIAATMKTRETGGGE